MTVVEREERYLMMLRRAVLGFARLLLVLAALALVAAVGLYAWSKISSSQFTLPVKSVLVGVTDPCPYLTERTPETNGKDSDGFIPAKALLSKCDASSIKPSVFDSSDTAFKSFADNLETVNSRLGWTFNRKEQAKRNIIRDAEDIQAYALKSLEEPKDADKLQIASLIALYGVKLKLVAAPAASWTDAAKEASEPISSNPDESGRTVVSREASDHLLGTRYLRNQLAVTVRKAHDEWQKHQIEAAGYKALSITAGYFALGLWGAFLSLMLTFVFIKIEVDLRDIRDRLTRASEAA